MTRRYLLSPISSIFLAALCLPATATAEQPWPRHAAEASFIAVKTASLPETLRDALLMRDEFR